MNYKTIKVEWVRKICFIQLFRPLESNTINLEMIEEISQVLFQCEKDANIVVLEGGSSIFCLGADLNEILNNNSSIASAQGIYTIWKKIALGSYISIAHIKGKVNAGGIGFVAACDIAIADNSSTFSLSELLFGLYPACVLPFLIRKVGFQKAHYFTIMTLPIDVECAYKWGIVDAYGENSDDILRKHLLRLERLQKSGIYQYKKYINSLVDSIVEVEEKATIANATMFGDKQNLQWINQYVKSGIFPWQKN